MTGYVILRRLTDPEICGVLIGTPDSFTICGLPGDPCVFHAHVANAPRTRDDLGPLWKRLSGQAWTPRGRLAYMRYQRRPSEAA